MSNPTNKSLLQWYEDRYSKDIWYGMFYHAEEAIAIETSIHTKEWVKKNVIDLGCGVGDLSMRLHQHGAIVTGIDYSQKAIDICKSRYPSPPNLGISFEHKCIEDVTGHYDIAVSQGTIEHLDNPYEAIKHIMDISDLFIFSCPNFVNPRGYVSLAIEVFAGQRVGGSDLHWIFPSDMNKFAIENNYIVTFKTCDIDWGCEAACIHDFKNRFKNTDTIEQYKIDYLVERLTKLLVIDKPTDVNGATAIYTLKKK